MSQETPAASAEHAAPRPAAKAPSRFRRVALMLLVPVLLAAGGAWMWLSGGRYVETEDAYLHMARVTIAAEVAGRVATSNVAENGPVQKGDVLFEVDPEPLRAALAQASAAVDSARLSVLQARAAHGLAQAQQQAAEVEAAYQKDNLDRQLGLAAKGVATSTSVDDVRHTADKAAEQLAAARQSVAAALAALGDSVTGDVDAHPAVAAALAARDRAAYNLAAATVRAPADGVVYQSTGFRPGLYVSPGASLFTIVETGAPWIDANLKETELVDVRPGQTADIAFDVDPDVHLKATVESIGAGTGAEFSLLPAQNATGNWVKVTQRIPVRLKLETPGADVLLRSGMSAQVAIDTGRSRSIADLFGRAHAAE